MTERNELAERIEALRERLHAAIKDPVYEVAASPLFMAAAQLLGKCRDEIAALRAPALPSEDEIARVIIRTCEDVGENEDEFCSDRMALASARAVLALIGKTGGKTS